MKTTVIGSGKGSQNGKSVSQSAGTVTKSATSEKPKAPEKEQKKEPKIVSLVTPADRFQRVEMFSKLQKRYEYLKERRNELDNFSISHDGSASKIELSNPTGGTVVISNPDVMKDVLTLCKSTIEKLLEKSELEVLEFEV